MNSFMKHFRVVSNAEKTERERELEEFFIIKTFNLEQKNPHTHTHAHSCSSQSAKQGITFVSFDKSEMCCMRLTFSLEICLFVRV
jgi:hypothetical protein